MDLLSPKTYLRRHYFEKIESQVKYLTDQDLERNSLVFAPHQDDETLGCGGTIINKRAAGADVHLAFMTDGRLSHQAFMPAEELAALRREEAIAAGEVLGISKDHIDFLNFEDGNLGLNQTEAVEQVLEILRATQPEDIYIPYYQDVLSDHIATNQIVRLALQMFAREVTVYEYPVWFWFHWPWVSVFQESAPQTRMALKNTVLSGLRDRTYADFKRAVDIREVLDQKKTALNMHKSQVVRLKDDPRWAILSDVSKGEFLSNFFRGIEIFHTYEFDPKFR